ncbi:MAG: hypothetical protein ACYCT7_06765 [bacterium]
MKKIIKNDYKKTSQSKILKQPETNTINYDDEKPVFSFKFLHSEYSIVNCTNEEKLSFLQTMYNLSNFTWKQIKQKPRHGLGFEKINNIKCQLPSQITDDVKLIAFRFHDKAPMVGYRKSDIFHIIFFDRNFTLYDH